MRFTSEDGFMDQVEVGTTRAVERFEWWYGRNASPRNIGQRRMYPQLIVHPGVCARVGTET